MAKQSRAEKEKAKIEEAKQKAEEHRNKIEKGSHGNKKEIPEGSDYTIEKGKGPFRSIHKGKTS